MEVGIDALPSLWLFGLVFFFFLVLTDGDNEAVDLTSSGTSDELNARREPFSQGQ